MPNATRFAPWFRFAGRPLPTLLLAAQGLAMPPVAAQEVASDPPAAVLRVARDQPRLDTPGDALSRRGPESSRRTNNSPTLNSPTLNSPVLNSPVLKAQTVLDSTAVDPQTASDAHPVSGAAAADGWTTRGSVRRRSSSNSRSLALQEQIEQFEAVELKEKEAEGDEPRFVEIIPESIEATPQRDREELPLREPTIPEMAHRGAAQANEPAAGRMAEESVADRRVADRRVADRRVDEESMAAGPKAEGAAAEVASQEPRRKVPAPVISAAAMRLKQPIEQCLQYFHQRPENTRERTPWGMLHAILPYGLDANVDADGRRYNAIAWLAGNNPCRDLKLLALSPSGRLAARTGIGLQGHQAQLLAILAQVGVPEDYPLYVGPRRFTVANLVQSEMAACRSGEELTFTLIGLSHYLPTNTSWTASDGQHWDFEKLIREELQQPVVGAACGGTHRLMGLNYALSQRRREGAPVTGQWERAAIFIDDFVAYAWQLQNRDGSFSTQWFEGREDNGQLDRKVQTTGHILEWLVFNATDEQLKDQRMVRGITFLANSMNSNRGDQWQVGPKGHALRALSLYHQRVFESRRPWRPTQTAAATANGRR